jgi:hypothetical protein
MYIFFATRPFKDPRVYAITFDLRQLSEFDQQLVIYLEESFNVWTVT